MKTSADQGGSWITLSVVAVQESCRVGQKMTFE